VEGLITFYLLNPDMLWACHASIHDDAGDVNAPRV